MSDPITIPRDDGSPLTLSRGEVVRAMAAMREANGRVDLDDLRSPMAGCECPRCERLRAREARRDG